MSTKSFKKSLRPRKLVYNTESIRVCDKAKTFFNMFAKPLKNFLSSPTITFLKKKKILSKIPKNKAISLSKKIGKEMKKPEICNLSTKNKSTPKKES